MNRFRIDMAYNGKNFSGFQIQPNKRTIQEEIEKVLSFLLKENVKIYASGRTDAGVSALCQVAHFDTEKEIIEKKLLDSLNALLPNDISILKVESVSGEFDARFSAKKKTYRYHFYISKYSHPIFDEYATRIYDYADVNLMQEACKYFIGTFDFKSFVSKKSGKTDFVRTVYDAKIISLENGIYAFEITGNGFLYNMVRIIFGTLTQVGYGKIKPQDVVKIIDGQDRSLSGRTMPSKALMLKNVDYN
ncbi:MAG: tRNA pseudouridine(38-40) synthase TruA [Clostridia bacterium]|nr:tRNA pseudouridine(38-40) synthase TruA [Clostridia bacterium]